MVYKNASTHERDGYGPNEHVPRFGLPEGVVMTGLLDLEGFEHRSDLSPEDKIDALTPEELKKFALQLKKELQQALKGRMELAGLFPDLENTETTLTDIEVAHDLSAELLRHVEFVQANFDTLKLYVEAYAARLRDSGDNDQLQLAQELEDLIAKIETGKETTTELLDSRQTYLRRILTAIHQIKIGHWDVFSKKGLWEKISDRDKNVFARYANSPSYVEANVKTPVEPSLARYRLSQLRGLMTGRTARKLAAGGATFAAGAIATTAMAGSDMPAQVAEHLAEADVCPDGQDNATINQIIKDLKSVLGIDAAALRDYVARCEMLLGNKLETESPTFGGIVDGSSAGDTSTFDSQFAIETTTEIGTPSPEQNGAQLPQLLVEFSVDEADKETMSSHVPAEPEFVNRDQGLLWYGDLHMLEDGTTLAGLPRFNESSQLHAEIMEVAQGILQLVVDQKIMSPEQVADQKIGLFFDNQTGQMKATIIWQTDSAIRFSNDFVLPAGTVMLFNQAGEWRYLSPEAGEHIEIWNLEQVKPHLFSKDLQVLGTASTGKVLLIVGPNGPNEALAANNTMLLNPESMTPLINAKTTSVNLRETPEAAGNTPVGSLKPHETAWPVPASELETLRAERGELFDAATDLDTSSGRIVANGEWVLVVEPQGRIVWVNMELVSEGEQSDNPASLVSAEATPPAPVTGQDNLVPENNSESQGRDAALAAMPDELRAEVLAHPDLYHYEESRFGFVDTANRVWRPNMATGQKEIDSGWLTETARTVVTANVNGKTYTLTYVFELNVSEMTSTRSGQAPNFSRVSFVPDFNTETSELIQNLNDNQLRQLFGDKTEATIFHNLVANVSSDTRNPENREVVDVYLFRSDNSVMQGVNVDKLAGQQIFLARTYSNWGAAEVNLGVTIEVVDALGTIISGTTNAQALNTINSRDRAAVFNHFIPDDTNPTAIVTTS